MRRRERDKEVVEEIATGLGFNPDDDEKVKMIPKIMKNMTQELTTPKLVVAFMYNPRSGEVVLTTPNIQPNDAEALTTVSEGCMEAAKQFSRIAANVRQKGNQSQQTPVERVEEVTNEEVETVEETENIGGGERDA